MTEIEINDTFRFGSVADVPAYQLPPEVWSLALNTRIKDMGIESLQGWQQVFGTLIAGNDSFTKVLLNFDGLDASTTITDTNAGGSAHVWSVGGNAQLDTAQKKFGSASLLLDGVGDYVTTNAHADFNFGANDFTIESWFNVTAPSGTYLGLAGQVDAAGTGSSNSFRIYRDFAAPAQMIFDAAGTVFLASTTGFTNVLNPGWHHIAVTRQGNVFRMFIDGVHEATHNIAVGALPNSSANLRVGWLGEQNLPWMGWVDGFKIDVGIARYTASFTPWPREYMTVTESAPHFSMPITTLTQNYWLYASLNKIFVYDGISHTNLTRLTGGVDQNYTVSNGRDWNGTILGGIPILNNGINTPQYWAPISTVQKMQNLTNWPVGMTAKILRAHGPFLIAFGLTEGGISFPHRIRWSHPADPGTLPTSWDINDATKDAGQIDLPDVNSGIIQDALQLGNYTYAYKETSTWRGRYVGGRSIFDWGEGPWSASMGLISPRCVALTGDGLRHVVATQDDIVWHNGNTIRSILNNRQRRRLANEISTEHYGNSFLFNNPLNDEMWFCYPAGGDEFPSKALILNYSDAESWAITEADGITFRHAAIGLIEITSEETWEDNPTETWEEGDDPWSSLERRRVVLSAPVSSKFLVLDKTGQRDGVPFTSTLQRTGLSMIGRKRTGEWIVNHRIRKLMQRLWPKIQGAAVEVRVGSSEVVNGSILWSDYVPFDPSVEVTADVPLISGRGLSVEFRSTQFFRLDGYKVDIAELGEF